jgi:hypothetical protein
LQAEDRHGTAIGHGAVRPHQCELMLLVDAASQHLDQEWIIDRDRFSVRSFNIDH